MGVLKQKFAGYLRSNKFKQAVKDKLKTGEITYNGIKIDAMKEAERFVAILQSEISGIRSETTGEAFLDHIYIVKPTADFETLKEGKSEKIVIRVNFIESDVHRESLYPGGYPDGAYLPYLFNNGYSAGNYVYGYTRHSTYIKSLIRRSGIGFMQRAIDEFNNSAPPGVLAIANINYDGGSFNDGYDGYY